MIPASLRRMLRNLSIRRKLTVIVMVTSGVAVILASALFLAYDYNSSRQQMVTDLKTTAESLGLQAYPALDAQSASSGVGTQARETLAFIVGSLRAYPSVEHAVIFDANGRPAGGLVRNILKERPTPPFTDRSTHAFADEGLVLYHRVTTPEGRFVGTIYLLSNTRELAVRLQRYLGILAGVTFVSLLASLLLASQLQKVISQPILHLAEIETRVSRDKDFSVRAVKEADDELGRPHRRLQRHARPDPVPRRRAHRGQGGGGAGEPHEEHLPRQHEPRAAHPAQRHHRLQRDARGGGGGARLRGPRPRPREDPRRRQAPARPHQRRARPLEDRGGQDGALPRGRSTCGPSSRTWSPPSGRSWRRARTSSR